MSTQRTCDNCGTSWTGGDADLLPIYCPDCLGTKCTDNSNPNMNAIADEPDIKCRCDSNQYEDDLRPHASWCLANPNRGIPDAEVTNSAKVVHRCEYRAAAYDRKLYADVIYRQLRDMREAVLAIHKPVPTWTDSTLDTATGETEQNALYDDDGSLVYASDHRMHCQTCPVDTPWPCPTADAIGVIW